ncbi:MAG: ATP-binding cassette domain-containing protein [Myxococcaceae bacterium]
MSSALEQTAVPLSCEALSVRFGRVDALLDISVSIAPGEQVLVTGQAASGKTTWLKCLAGLQPPTSGHVRWGADDVAGLGIEERRKRQRSFGMVFQSDALFDSMTVLDNVMLPLTKRQVPHDEALERARAVLERVGLSSAHRKRPEELSGGMKKRVGVARAIVAQPSILLADDPFAGLDPSTERSIAELLLEVSRGRTLVTALPDPVASLPLSRVLRFEQGRLGSVA